MYLFNVTMTDGAGHDLTLPVAANDGLEALERAERLAIRRGRYEAWRIVRCGFVH